MKDFLDKIFEFLDADPIDVTLFILGVVWLLAVIGAIYKIASIAVGDF